MATTWTRGVNTGRAVSMLLSVLVVGLTSLPAFGADLAISEGVVVKFGHGAQLVVRDQIHADKQVTFTSVRDDSIGGQTGAQPQPPAPGDWRGIKIEASATTIQLHDTVIRFGGLGALDIRKLSPAINYLVVRDALIGIHVIDGAAPLFDGLSLMHNQVGMEVDTQAKPTIMKSQIEGNTSIGVSNRTPATVVQAVGNWWGHPSGPKDPIGNPLGQGDAVSTGVNYGAWATVIPLINPTLAVVGGIFFTEQPTVTLLLSCRNAVEYRVAENNDFTGKPFLPMSASTPFTVSDGDGVKQIAVQYRAATGNVVTASLPQGLLFDTQGPSVTIASPAEGSFITKSITIDTSVSDPAGVAKVEFYIDNVLKSTDTSAPYSYFWDIASFADGSHIIKVIAYDSVGHSTTELRSVVLTKEAPPPPDTSGPSTTNLKIATAALTEGSVIVRSGTMTASVSDPSGVSRVEFLLDGVVIGSDTNGADGYSAFLEIATITDGSHSLTVRAFDSLNNMSQVTVNVTVALAPPAAPGITQPANGLLTNQAQLTVSGQAEKFTQVLVHNNDQIVAGPINVDANGNFSAPVTLVSGQNRLQAAAQNRGGASPLSATVTVTLDTSIPEAPLGLTAAGQASGKIRLSWVKPADASVAGYHLYRSSQAFTTPGEATKANSNLITNTFFDDLPAADGSYFYRVVAVNALGTPSSPSNQATAVADSTLPQAVAIVYQPLGKFDPATGRFGVGRVSVIVTVSEPLLAAPFLSIAPANGVPIAVDLLRQTDTEYRGGFDITEFTPSGTAFAVFSGRDVVGNRGTEIMQGASLKIDAQGPRVTGLAIAPKDPIRNDAANPATVTLNLTLDEALKPNETPQLRYTRSTAPTQEIAITKVTQTGPLAWQVSFVLAAEVGASAVETIKFLYTGRDDLDNVSSAILAPNTVQVYQGDLPPLGVPQNLTALAQPQGRVKLSWGAVEGAPAYRLYRQAPGETALSAYQTIEGAVEFIDGPLADGLYRYAVASLRRENGQEAVSNQSNPVDVTADATAPGTPQNLTLTLTGQGIRADWQAPAGGGVATYSLYRSSAPVITSLAGLTPIKTGIKTLTFTDPQPSLTDHSYVVTAVDAAGNESAISNSAFLNFALLPVSNLSVVQNGGELPVITWTHSGQTIAGYDVYLGPDNAKLKLNSTRLTAKTYTDTGFAGDERRYTVVAVDNNNNEIGRSITLPKLTAQIVSGLPLKRGVMNRLHYQVSNAGGSAASNIRIKTKIGERENVSESFSLNPGETRLMPVVVGGFADIPNLVVLTNTIEVTPNEGESVRIVRGQQVEAQDGSLVLSLATESFTRGATGKARFTLENTSTVEIEAITALATGNSPSNQARFKLLDKDNNVLATQAFKQATGQGVITLANGITVARIPAGATFTSDWFEINVPASAPTEATLQFEIDQFHYHLGQADAVAIPGMSGRQAVPLIDTAYTGEITSITPASSYGDQNVIIQGRAVSRASGQPLPSAALRLILRINGFERKYDVFTDASGNFSHTFKPQPGEAGIYKVSVVHPDILDRPEQGQFVINQVNVQPTLFKLNIPKNYSQTLNVVISTGDGTSATNARLVYEAAAQPSGGFIPGIQVSLGPPVSLGPKQSGALTLTLSGDNTAPTTGVLVFKVLTDERGSTPLTEVRVDYLLSDAKPSLFASPSFIETGVAYDTTVVEQLTLENKGLAAAEGVAVKLLNTDGTPAPAWIYLTTPASLGSIAVGERRTIDMAVSPTTAVTQGVYTFKLHVTSANLIAGDINIFVSVTQSGIGQVLFKAADIFTGTLDKNGNLVPGLAGARIEVQNEQVLTVARTLFTDNQGEVLFTDLPAGRYRFRASAANHQDTAGRFDVKPGVTTTQSLFLDYNLISVSWTVNEITIGDKYEVVLTATYETNVPAAVVVSEPSSVNLPLMKPGDVFYGELTLTNYGLIRADDVTFALPPEDANFRYEVLGTVPKSLAAKERITIPYRVVSLTALEPSGSDSGGGCFTYHRQTTCTYGYICANGQLTSGSTSTSFLTTYGCSTASGGGGGGAGGGGPGAFVGFGGGGGGLTAGSSPAPTPTEVPGAKCIPLCGAKCCGPGGGGPGGDGDGGDDGGGPGGGGPGGDDGPGDGSGPGGGPGMDF